MLQKPNIVYIHSHDTGRFIQPYGYAVPTPNLQRFAEQSVVFRNAHNAAPQCSPSRAALLTGQWPHNCGMYGLVNRGFELEHTDHLLESTLRENGYRTALYGVQHVVADPAVMAYDEIVPLQNIDGIETAEAACDYLKRAEDQPFFLSVGFFDTHRPLDEIGPDDNPDFCRPMPPLPDTQKTRTDMAAFCTSARRLDACMGRVFDTLDDCGLAANTLVLCTTDHGPAFPGMKCTLSDAGTGVLLMMRWPNGFEGGHVCDALVSQIDVFPTVCGLLDIDPPDWLQGTSMESLLHGSDAEINNAVFAEQTYHCLYEPMRSVRTKRWKYIWRPAERNRFYAPHCDEGPSKDLWIDNGWLERPIAEEQLYDLMFDPHEAGKPDRRRCVQGSRRRHAPAAPRLDGRKPRTRF